MISRIDDKIEKLGFKKLTGEDEEDKFGVSYRREFSNQKYNQRVDILYMPNGKHMITSYEERINNEGLNNVIGITYPEAILFAKKLKEMKKKYKWE